jgi:hypothetical protein
MSNERDDWQKHLASLYEASLVTSLGIVEDVTPNFVTDPKGVSPLVCVTASGTNFFDSLRQMYARTPVSYYVDVFVFVLHSRKVDSYTNADADRLCSLIAQEIINANVENDSRPGMWSSIEYREPTRVTTSPEISGVVYQIESHRLNLIR